MRIAVSGKSGCGNTTVSRIVAETLGYTLINYTFRTMAEELGIPFKEVCALAELDDSYDMQLDERQVALASIEDCVLGSRLAIWMLKEADIKVYLTASTDARARRIHQREDGDFALRLQETLDRDIHDSARYRRIYGIDNDDYSFADLVIDTESHDQYQVAAIIVEEAVRRGATIQRDVKSV